MQNRIKYIAVVVITVITTLATAAPAEAQFGGRLISRHLAQRAGLHRAWFSQVRVDRGRSQVVRWLLSYDQLFVLTDAAVLHSLDANTGQTLWIAQVGNPQHPASFLGSQP